MKGEQLKLKFIDLAIVNNASTVIINGELMSNELCVFNIEIWHCSWCRCLLLLSLFRLHSRSTQRCNLTIVVWLVQTWVIYKHIVYQLTFIATCLFSWILLVNKCIIILCLITFPYWLDINIEQTIIRRFITCTILILYIYLILYWTLLQYFMSIRQLFSILHCWRDWQITILMITWRLWWFTFKLFYCCAI